MNAGRYTRCNIYSQHWSRENATVRWLRQTRNIGTVENLALSVTRQNVYITGNELRKQCNQQTFHQTGNQNTEMNALKQTNGGWYASLTWIFNLGSLAEHRMH